MAFELPVWTSNRMRARDVLQSALNYAIASAFALNGVKLG
jgi:small-conductance mechanosensitive channel